MLVTTGITFSREKLPRRDATLLTAPHHAHPAGLQFGPRWSDRHLTSVRNEIVYLLTDPELSDKLIAALERMRSEIEAEMRTRLKRSKGKAESARRGLFQETEIDYSVNKAPA